MDKSLKYAAFAGILSLITLFPVIILDLLKEFAKYDPKFIFIHVSLQFISTASYLAFAWAFKVIGDKYKNNLLVTMTYIVIAGAIVYYIYELMTLIYPELESFIVSIAALIVFGIVGIPFGIAQLRLKKKLGGIATGAGVLNIITSACFVTVILAPVGLVLSIVTAIVEIVLVFRAAGKS